MKTRGSERMCFNLASRMIPLDPEHIPDEEVEGFTFFKNGVEGLGLVKVILRTGHYYESVHGACYSRVIRYATVKQKTATIRGGDEVEYWTTSCCTVRTAADDLRLYLNNFEKPIAVLVGQKIYRKNVGHCVTLILHRLGQETTALVKDSLPISDATIMSRVYELLGLLHVTEVQLVGLLPEEEYVTHTDCIRESFRVVGDVLDGKNPAHFHRRPTLIARYSVGRRIQTQA